MNPHTEIIGIAGPAGRIDIALDRPREQPVRGIALIAHPHPLYGGTRDNKVVQTLARTLLALGYVCWRPNFRGVGESEGAHDEGRGETDDLLAVIASAASDNRIDPEEAVKIRKRWEELKRSTETFVACCEAGNFHALGKDAA